MNYLNATPNLPGMNLVQPFRFATQPREYKVVSLRECPVPDEMALCDTPARAAQYWQLHVAENPYFNAECECFAVLLLNTRRRVKGHQLLSIGTQDTILVHPREVFRLAVVTSAAAGKGSERGRFLVLTTVGGCAPSATWPASYE